MEPNEKAASDARLAELLAAYEQARAEGRTPDPAAPQLEGEALADWYRAVACLELLRERWSEPPAQGWVS